MSYEFGNHISVLKDEIIENISKLLDVSKELIGADLTFGGGGHVFSILEAHGNFKIFGVDQDPDAITSGQKKIDESPFKNQIKLLYSNFVDFPQLYEKEKSTWPSDGLDFITIDLGVSSHQFDLAERGFSFREDGPLDMRMNYSDDSILTAEDIVNSYDEEDLANVIYKYGEERLSRRIAKNIVEQRKKERIDSTKKLENIIFHSYPANQRHKKPHPATRTFQALRIEVNKELQVIEDVIPELFNLLSKGGILQIITFHSLEDRIVKWSYKNAEKERDDLKILTKKPIIPTQSEILNNPRARSAKLRVIQKTS